MLLLPPISLLFATLSERVLCTDRCPFKSDIYMHCRAATHLDHTHAHIYCSCTPQSRNILGVQLLTYNTQLFGTLLCAVRFADFLRSINFCAAQRLKRVSIKAKKKHVLRIIFLDIQLRHSDPQPWPWPLNCNTD